MTTTTNCLVKSPCPVWWSFKLCWVTMENLTWSFFMSFGYMLQVPMLLFLVYCKMVQVPPKKSACSWWFLLILLVSSSKTPRKMNVISPMGMYIYFGKMEKVWKSRKSLVRDVFHDISTPLRFVYASKAVPLGGHRKALSRNQTWPAGNSTQLQMIFIDFPKKSPN